MVSKLTRCNRNYTSIRSIIVGGCGDRTRTSRITSTLVMLSVIKVSGSYRSVHQRQRVVSISYSYRGDSTRRNRPGYQDRETSSYIDDSSQMDNDILRRSLRVAAVAARRSAAIKQRQHGRKRHTESQYNLLWSHIGSLLLNTNANVDLTRQ